MSTVTNLGDVLERKMKSLIQFSEKGRNAYMNLCLRSYAFSKSNSNVMLFLFGTLLLGVGIGDLSIAEAKTFKISSKYDDAGFRVGTGNLFALVEGSFGALVLVVTGIGAIVASSMGQYKAAVSLIVVAVGAFCLRAFISLFFGTNFQGQGVGTEFNHTLQ